MGKVEFKDQVASFWLVFVAPAVSGCGEACIMEGDPGFEDAGERLDRERFSDPWSGPFLTQSSWEQYKDEAEVSECDSVLGTRAMPLMQPGR